jgi:hypothetical protein
MSRQGNGVEPLRIAHAQDNGLGRAGNPSLRSLELAADFDDLANIERVQDHHRRELSKRQQALDAQEQTCRELEEHLKRRLEQLVVEAIMLERFLDGATTPMLGGVDRPSRLGRLHLGRLRPSLEAG